MKKVLIISYYFPPVGIAYAYRTLKFAKYFPKFQWEPFVLTDTPKNYFFKDKELLDSIDENIHICRTHRRGSKNLLTNIKLSKIPNEGSRKLFRNMSAMRKLPDRQKSWIKKAKNRYPVCHRAAFQ